MSRAGLLVFVVVLLLNVAGIFLDFFLLVCKMTTITVHSRSYPLIGVTIILLQFLAMIGIAIHFFLESFGGYDR